jgi:hypothetical protein
MAGGAARELFGYMNDCRFRQLFAAPRTDCKSDMRMHYAQQQLKSAAVSSSQQQH